MLDILEEAARQAGKVLLDHYGTDLQVQNKASSKDILTQADLLSQKTIKETILRLSQERGLNQQDLGFIGEEELFTPGRYKFIIDPLDGTTNFAAGFGYFCISIACIDNETIAGVVYEPISDTLFAAEKGKGAYKKVAGKKTKLEVVNQEINSVIAIHFNGGESVWQKQFEVYSRLYPKVRALRVTGSITLDLCLLADNVFGAVINGGCYIWDIAAAALIIEESRGVLVDWQGQRVKLDLEDPKKPFQIIAGNSHNVRQIQGLF